MRWVNVLRSGAFRFTLTLAIVFALGAAGLLIVVDCAIADYALEATATSLSNESATVGDLNLDLINQSVRRGGVAIELLRENSRFFATSCTRPGQY